MLEKLNFRIQQKDDMNDIYVDVDPDKTLLGITPDSYQIQHKGNVILKLNFQNIYSNGDKLIENKILNQDLLEIVRHRLTYDVSRNKYDRNITNALTHLEEALMWLAKDAAEVEESENICMKDSNNF